MVEFGCIDKIVIVFIEYFESFLKFFFIICVFYFFGYY